MHELRGIEQMPHSFFSTTLMLSGLCVAGLAVLVWYFQRRHKRKPVRSRPVLRSKPTRRSHKTKRHRSSAAPHH